MTVTTDVKTESAQAPWSFDADEGDITLHGAPIFRLYREWDFPCIEDEDRAAADLEYLAHATVVVMLLNTIATTTEPTVGAALAKARGEQPPANLPLGMASSQQWREIRRREPWREM